MVFLEMTLSKLLYPQSDQCLATHFVILKGLRVKGLLNELEENHINLLRDGLEHSSTEVRLGAFAVICHLKKKGLTPSITELVLAEDFIIDNLSVDEPSFRQVSLQIYFQWCSDDFGISW